MHTNHPGGDLVKMQIPIQEGLGWGLTLCLISNKLPGDADAAGPGSKDLNLQPWGSFNKYRCWNPTPDQLHQNLWMAGSGYQSILNALRVSLICSQVEHH